MTAEEATISGKYTSYFVGTTQVSFKDNRLTFSGIRKWDGKKKLILGLVTFSGFYFLSGFVYRSLPTSLYPWSADIIGLLRLAVLILYVNNQFEIWFHKNPADQTTITLQTSDIASVQLSPRKTNMIITTKDKNHFPSGRFVVKASQASQLSTLYEKLNKH